MRLRGSRGELVGVRATERLDLGGLLVLGLTLVMGYDIASALVVPSRGKWLLLAHRPFAYVVAEMNAEPMGKRRADSRK